ncbi:hypothetical protein EV183_002573, partial [Coemansia sp. RSA 2336]
MDSDNNARPFVFNPAKIRPPNSIRPLNLGTGSLANPQQYARDPRWWFPESNQQQLNAPDRHSNG